ncbi:SH3 domain-containing protein [Micromonospora inyonensis]|uniref:SH3 domain-containing protein n=1 Tax=Micromonospora inyonensis TaxID=47866 RepID=A0A1C6SEU5_9ACTN|nr:SH3 domain-containing protein [Micromonospora inyonensis]SCL27819.1 hypothetical protein GA0074694_4923 [Micromonospora inyonensis]
MPENRTTRHLVRIALATGTAGALLLTGTPASAAGPYISSNSGGANIRSCPNTGCTSNGYYGNGTGVTMVCYTDAQWVYPPSSNYASNRWLKVNSPTTGYIHSSLVANQVSTPRC